MKHNSKSACALRCRRVLHRDGSAGIGRRSAQDDHRPARQLGHRDPASRRQGRHLQEARPRARDDLHLRRGETLQPVISGSVDIGLRRRHARRHGGLFQGRAGAHHRRGGDRRRRLLVRQDDPAIKTLKDTDGKTIAFSTNGSSTQSDRARLHQRVQADAAKPTATGNPAVDADRGDDRPGRCRLGLAAVRPQGDRRTARSTSSPRPPMRQWCAARPSASSSPMPRR